MVFTTSEASKRYVALVWRLRVDKKIARTLNKGTSYLDAKFASDEILESFEWSNLDDVGGRFGGNVHEFAGLEGIRDILLSFPSGLLDLGDLEQAGKSDGSAAVFADLFGHECGEAVVDGGDIGFGHAGILSEGGEELCLGKRLLDGFLLVGHL